jgi:hypothetical protein
MNHTIVEVEFTPAEKAAMQRAVAAGKAAYRAELHAEICAELGITVATYEAHLHLPPAEFEKTLDAIVAAAAAANLKPKKEEL